MYGFKSRVQMLVDDLGAGAVGVSKVGSDSGFQSPPIFGDFSFPPPFFPFFSVIFSSGHALL